MIHKSPNGPFLTAKELAVDLNCTPEEVEQSVANLNAEDDGDIVEVLPRFGKETLYRLAQDVQVFVDPTPETEQ